MGTNERVVVKLTERGQKSYKTKLYSRPAKEPESSGDTYVFYCSPLQAYNYFFPFGKEAKIIEPTSLREKFKNSYKIIYSCDKCHELHKNIMANDDNFDLIISLSKNI